jgi:hypothetical protein
MTAMCTVLFVGEEPIDDSRLRLRLVGEALDGCVHRVGRPVALSISSGGGRPVRLVCRIERFDPSELRLDVILPTERVRAARWARAAEIGDPV